MTLNLFCRVYILYVCIFIPYFQCYPCLLNWIWFMLSVSRLGYVSAVCYYQVVVLHLVRSQFKVTIIKDLLQSLVEFGFTSTFVYLFTLYWHIKWCQSMQKSSLNQCTIFYISGPLWYTGNLVLVSFHEIDSNVREWWDSICLSSYSTSKPISALRTDYRENS